MMELKDRVNEIIRYLEISLQGPAYYPLNKTPTSYSVYGVTLKEYLMAIKDQQARIEELENDNKSLEKSIKALESNLGDNCCACSYDHKDDVCAVHVPRVNQLEAAIREHLEHPLMGSKDLKEVLGK